MWFDIFVYKIFKLKRTCWLSYMFINNLILILVLIWIFFINCLLTLKRWPIIFFWNLSLINKGIIFLNCFSWMDFRLNFHIIGINWGDTLGVGKIFRIKWRMVNNNLRSFSLCLSLVLGRYFIRIQRLRSHFLCF